MSRLIAFYCLMIAGALSLSSAEPTEYEIHTSAVNQYPYHYDPPDSHQAPAVQITRSIYARDREASWQHHVLAHYTKTVYPNIARNNKKCI